MDNGMSGSVWQLLFMLIWVLVVVVPFWKITGKAGYPGWLSLLVIIPLVNVVYIYFLAFSKWPSLSGSDQ